MKRLRIISLITMILLFSLSSYSQSVNYKDYYGFRNQLKTGVGITYNGTESMVGHSIFMKYHYFFNKNISLTTDFSVMNFSKDKDDLLLATKAENFQLNLQLYLLQRNRYCLFVGGGGSLRYFHWTISNLSTKDRFELYDEEILPLSHGSIDQFSAGYNFIIGVGFYITPLISVELAELYQNDAQSNNNWDTRIGLSVKF